MSAASLAAVRKTVFNPLLQTRAEIAAFLASQPSPAGTAHPFNRTLLLHADDDTSSALTEIDLTDKDESFFFSATDLNSLSETITARIERFSTDLAPFKSYTIISLTTPYLEVPFVPGEKTIVVLSERKPTYYDFCIGNAAGEMVLYCNTTHAGLPGVKHSGDMNQADSLLHHIVFSEPLTEEPFGLFVSGYSYNSLHKYKPQNPAVTIADHHAKILYVVPVPLDEATIGDATLCIPVVGRRRGDKLCFSVLPSAVTSDQVAAGPKLPGDTLARAIAREPAAPPPPTPTTVTPGTTAKPDKKKARLEESDEAGSTAETVTLVDVDVAKPLFVTEEGCTLPSFVAGHDGNHITFFQGITVHPSRPPHPTNDDKKTVVLPCALGNPLEGSMILALGTPFVGAKVSYEQYTRLFDKASIVVFTVSDRMTDQARVLNPDIRCNALYILQTRVPVPDQSTASVEDILNDTKINAITALAGPQSVVVVQLGDRYYFYRGIRWAGLLDEIPKFGEDITEMVEAVLGQPPAKHPWNNIVSIGGDEPKVYFRGTLCSPDELYTNFTSLQPDELESFKLEILDTLAQLQVALSPKALPEFTSKLQNKLKEMMDATIAPHKKAYVDSVLASKGQTRDPRLMEKYRKAEKAAKVSAQWLIDALAALVSSRISSTRKYDLKQMIRKQKIMDNVAASKDMTYADLATILEEHCTEIGMVIANIDSEQFRTLLQKAKENAILPHLQQLTLTPDPSQALSVCKLDDRVQYLSGLDCGIILPLAQDGHHGPLATTTGKLALGFPYGVSDDKSGSAFAFACFDQFINIKHPYSQFWVELCNVHHVSMLRILQRNTISAAVQSREFNIPPASKDLGFLLAYALTDAMRSLATTRAAVPPEARGGEDVDTTTKMMRGLFGYLMTLLAAGVQPMSMAWQLLSRTSAIEVPPPNEFWLYSRIVDLFPYTAWPRAQFAKNVRLLVARLVRKQMTDPVTKVLRDGVSQIKQDAIREQVRTRNVTLKWGEVGVEVLSRLILGGYEPQSVKEAAGRIVELVPETEIDGRKGSRGTTRVFRALHKLAESGDVAKVDEDTRVSAANTYAKRSAALKDLKTRFVDAAVAGDVAAAKSIYEEMQQKRRDVAALFGLKSVKLQNEKNIDSVLGQLQKGEEMVKKEVLRRLKADAEIYRAPWQVGKPTDDNPPPPSKMHLVGYVLTGNMVDTAVSSTEVAAVAEKPQTLEQRLTALPGGEKAAKLAVVIDKVVDVAEFVKLSGLPKDDFLRMWRYSNGRSGEEEVDVLKRVVVMFLEGWQDVVAAEGRVVAYLRGQRGAKEEKEIQEAEEKAGVPKVEEKKDEGASA
ncbi:hypothetical protein TWF696_001837 [Orbilia brochopaga]|uniref:Uncharacterized protein n=1 Tax=Orbilia brochopaga TaxID=3140254 RepID=A0AAV9U6I8_9PEZI